MMLRFLSILLTAISLFPFARAGNGKYAASSVLSSGRWVKIEVGETGIYKLTASDLKQMGFSDLSKVSIYGYGGWPLDESFTDFYPDDLPPVPVWKGSDYLLFYAKGTVRWKYDNSSSNADNNRFIHIRNPYSLKGYYFVTDHTQSKEMSQTPLEKSSAQRITTFDDYRLHEEELVSVHVSGRQLFGESFASLSSQTFSDMKIPGVTNDPGKVEFRFVSKVASKATVTMSIDDTEVLKGSIYAPGSDEYPSYLSGKETNPYGIWNGTKSENPKVKISYSPGGNSSAYLDYIRLNMKRELKPYGAYTFFRSVETLGTSAMFRFVIAGADDKTMVWDVTDGLNVTCMETELNGSDLSFTIPGSSVLREFVIVQSEDRGFPVPKMVGDAPVVPGKDLHALPQRDMIIIAAPNFREEAERLAEAHRKRDGLTVEVVNPADIYNEFSSGTPDATAYRRFMKMFYDRRVSDGSDAPKYLLLFGDGAYDNRYIVRDWKNRSYLENLLLTFQSENSLNIYSYTTDDYFGFLDDGSGSLSGSDALRIGVGRFPVRTVTEARQMVDKVIGYMSNTERGSWKNKLCFIADDGNNADTFTTSYMRQANALAETIEVKQSQYLSKKILFDAYPKDQSGSGVGSYPAVRTNIKKALRDGLVMINYTGHGNENSWADENVWNTTDIVQSTYSHLPLWVTATCDFTRFDALETSAGESVFLNAKSGGIALFTTTRPVFSGGNKELNEKLVGNMFKTNSDGTSVTLGDMMMNTKNALLDVNKLNFVLIGDPAMRLNYPTYTAAVTRVNGMDVTTGTPVLKALERVTIEGVVNDREGNVASGFDGLLYPIVLDSKVTSSTLDNNNKGYKVEFTDYPNTIYIGIDSVRQGRFSFSFTVPKDISYSNDFGKINLYASDDNAGEASGSFKNFKVGSSADVADRDTVGPEIRSIFLNDSSFTDGGKVNTTPFFVARIWDQSGVNITGNSLGHDIILTIDGDPALSYNLNDYYEVLPSGAGEGLVAFSIPALPVGMHKLDFKVWDVINNPSSRSFTFEVVEGLKPRIVELTAGPIPARDQITFYLYHDYPECRLNVSILVYDLTGRLQWRHDESGSSDLFKSYNVSWDLTNNRGSRLTPGVYVYRLLLGAPGTKDASKAKKLIILGQ